MRLYTDMLFLTTVSYSDMQVAGSKWDPKLEERHAHHSVVGEQAQATVQEDRRRVPLPRNSNLASE